MVIIIAEDVGHLHILILRHFSGGEKYEEDEEVEVR